MPNVEALVLAAGLSSRMKNNKLLLKLGKNTIIRQTLDNILASRVSGITVIVGHRKKELSANLAGYNVNIIENPCYVEGMSSSLKTGMQSIVNSNEAAAVIIFNGDMPFIKPATIDSIIAAYEKSGALIVAPFYQGRRGHPVLFDRKLFSELLDIDGDMGAREVLRKNSRQVLNIAPNDPGVHQDIDCPDDYRRLASQELSD